jgi:hypothetical protein
VKNAIVVCHAVGTVTWIENLINLYLRDCATSHKKLKLDWVSPKIIDGQANSVDR